MSLSRTLAVTVACLLSVSAVAQDTTPADVSRARLELRRRNNQRPASHRISLKATLPTSQALSAVDPRLAEMEVQFAGVTAFHMATNNGGKLYKEIRPGVFRMRRGPFPMRLDTNTGRFRIRNRRADLGPLAASQPEGVTISVRFDDLEFTQTVDFESRRQVWRYSAPQD